MADYSEEARFGEPDKDGNRGRRAAGVQKGGQPGNDDYMIARQMYSMEARLAAKQPGSDWLKGTPLTGHTADARCVHCNQVFGSDHGLKIHMGRAHGDVSDAH